MAMRLAATLIVNHRSESLRKAADECWVLFCWIMRCYPALYLLKLVFLKGRVYTNGGESIQMV